MKTLTLVSLLTIAALMSGCVSSKGRVIDLTNQKSSVQVKQQSEAKDATFDFTR